MSRRDSERVPVLSTGHFRLDWILAIRNDDRLGSTDKHLGLTLATFMDPDGLCWPSVTTIAAAMAVDPRTVQRHIQQDAGLLAYSYLEVIVGGAKGGANRYQARLPNPPARRRPPDPGTPPGDPGAVSNDPGTTPPELVKNPSENPSSTTTTAPARTRAPNAVDADIANAIRGLVWKLDDSDENSYDVFAAKFGHLRPEDFEYSLRETIDHDYGIAYAYAILETISDGIYCLPAELRDARLDVLRRGRRPWVQTLDGDSVDTAEPGTTDVGSRPDGEHPT